MPGRSVAPEDLLELVLVSSPSISRDGLVAYTVTRLNRDANRYESATWLAGPEGFRPLTSGPGDVCPKWSPDGRLLAFVRRPQEKGGKSGLYVAGRDGGAWRVAESRFGFRSIEWSPDGRWIYFTRMAPLRGGEAEWKDYSEREVLVVESLPIWFNGEGFVFDRRLGLYRADVRSGIVEEVARGDFNVVAYAVSPDGRVAYARTYDELKPFLHEVVLRERDGGEDVVHRGFSVAGLAWSPDGGSLALHARDVSRRGFAAHFQVYKLDPGGDPECLTCSLERDVMNTVNSDVRGPSCSRTVQWGDDGWIYFLVSDAGSVHLYRVKPGSEPEPLIAPSCGVVDEYSVAGGRVAYTFMTPTRPKEVYLLDGGEARRLTGHNDRWIETRRLVEPRKYAVEASDGALIDVWVLDPGGEEPRPWVLYIHGGPKTMYGCGFIHEFHALAGAGFAVVYSNPRGSDGYTEEFADIRGRYGERDYKDLMEVAEQITRLHEGLDPERAGVTGGSYGGFMTNWIVTHTNRFKAAVTQRSCSNWVSKYGTTDIGWYFNKDQIARGEPVWRALETYWDKSPLKYVENARTPLLIIHSLEDYRCYVDQATQMFVALKELGVKVKLALFPGENHDLSRSGRPKSRIARLKLIIDWFREHLGKAAGSGEGVA
ncbi:S9 family peptidase [Stetteria hydrogenophila]